MSEEKPKDTIFEMIQVEAMYKSIEIAYKEYEEKMESLSPAQRERSTMIVVEPPIGFQAYIKRIMKQEAENSTKDIVLMNCGEEVKRVKGKLKSKPKKKNELERN